LKGKKGASEHNGVIICGRKRAIFSAAGEGEVKNGTGGKKNGKGGFKKKIRTKPFYVVKTGGKDTLREVKRGKQ